MSFTAPPSAPADHALRAFSFSFHSWQHSLDEFTSVADFEKAVLQVLLLLLNMSPLCRSFLRVLQSLEYMDTILPKGSHVVFIGFIKGELPCVLCCL